MVYLFNMEIVEKQIKVYKTSGKVFLKPLALWGLLIIILAATLASVEIILIWFGGIAIIGTIAFLVSGTLKITIDSNKKLVTIEKTNFLGNLLETKVYLLNRYHFKITSRTSYRSGKHYFFSFRDTSYKGGELYYTDVHYTDEYSTGGFSKKTVQLIENDIQKIQDKKV
ncbi:hypothetical protein SAMN04487979_10237 [Flavobacterium sp. ov086]|nr:hypothetical protein SAMN04487979_10237 [Flavobacterium sp. ov086]